MTKIDPEIDETVGSPDDRRREAGAIVTGEGFVWVTRPEDGSVIRIEPESNLWTGDVFEVGKDPQGLIVADGSVWVANQGDNTLTRLIVEGR